MSVRGISKRRFTALFLALLLALGALSVPALAADTFGGGAAAEAFPPAAPNAAPRVALNGVPLPLGRPPVTEGGCLMVPLHGFLDALGITVEWNAEKQTFLCWRGTTSVLLQLGIARMAAQVDRGEIVFSDLDAAPFTLGGQVMVPLRAVAEAFGCTVAWDAAAHIVQITD